MAVSEARKRALKKYRETHREQIREYQRAYRAQNPEKVQKWKRDARIRELKREVKRIEAKAKRLFEAEKREADQ